MKHSLVALAAALLLAGCSNPPAAEKASIVAGVLAAVWPAIEAGEVRPVVDRVLPLAEVAQAHRLLEASTHVGKVVLQIAPL